MSAPAAGVDAAAEASRASPGLRLRPMRLTEVLVPIASVLAALVLWEVVSRTGLIAERDLSPMTTTFSELWSLMHTGDFWSAVLHTVRGWAVGLAVAVVLADPGRDRAGLERLRRGARSACRSSSCARSPRRP